MVMLLDPSMFSQIQPSRPGRKAGFRQDLRMEKETPSPVLSSSSPMMDRANVNRSLPNKQTTFSSRLSPRRPKQKSRKNGIFLADDVDWHRDIQKACQSLKWDHVRVNLKLCSAQLAARTVDVRASAKKNKFRGTMMWLQRIKGHSTNSDVTRGKGDRTYPDLLGLMAQDAQGRTPLYACLCCREPASKRPTCPVDVLLQLVQLEPKACTIANDRYGRLPLHLAVLYRHDLEVISALVGAHPVGMLAEDCRGETPFSYAVEMAKKGTDLRKAPKEFWMPAPEEEDSSNKEVDDDAQPVLRRWQEEQCERWAVVHWFLLSSTMHSSSHSQQNSQTITSELLCLFGGYAAYTGPAAMPAKPLLVEALLYAAPPPLVSILIRASHELLRLRKDGKRASAIAGSSLYSCIARHYPLEVLKSLAASCPPDVRHVRDETGMGLVSAQFVSGIFQQDYSTQEWKIQHGMFAALQRSVANESLHLSEVNGEGGSNNVGVAFLDWWKKIEALVAFCDGNESMYMMKIRQQLEEDSEEAQGEAADMSFPTEYLLHCAVRNPDIPPSVLRLICALNPDSMWLPDPMFSARNNGPSRLPIHVAASTPEYIPRNYEIQIMGGKTNA